MDSRSLASVRPDNVRSSAGATRSEAWPGLPQYRLWLGLAEHRGWFSARLDRSQSRNRDPFQPGRLRQRETAGNTREPPGARLRVDQTHVSARKWSNNSSYMTVVFHYTRGQNLSFFPRKLYHIVPFQFHPRQRPDQGILSAVPPLI